MLRSAAIRFSRRGVPTQRLRAVAFAVLALAYLALVWWVSHHGASFGDEPPWDHPIAISGDEPHYLVTLNSIVFDGDLNLHEDYLRVARGGFEAGVRFRGTPLQPHTIFVDPVTGEHAYANDVYDWKSLVPCGPYCYEFKRAHTGFAAKPEPLLEVPIHPPAFPALLAVLIAPFRPTPMSMERFASTIVSLSVWLTVLLTYVAGRSADLTREEALASAALLGVASPHLAYANAFYAEPAIGLALIASLWSFETRRSITAAVLLFIAVAMKPPFAIVGATWIIERIWSGRPHEAFRFGGVLSACGIALVAFNWSIARMPMIGPRWDWGHDYLGTLLDTRNGLLPFVPWAAVSFVGLGWTRVRGEGRHATLLRLTLWPAAAFALLLAFKGGPGACYGPRLWIPLIPFLALAATVTAGKLGRPARYALLVVGALACAVAIPGALQYPVLFNQPPEAAWYRR